jgi:hypothetical protein
MVSAFYSCNKNNNPTPEPANNGRTYTADEMALWRQLNNFNQKIKTGLKSEEFVSPDSAMWYLEALFNVQQATDTTFNEVKSYERTYSLNVNTNGTVNMSEVVNVYNQLVTDLDSELSQIASDYKFLIIADLEQESLKAGTFTISLMAGLGINPLVLYEPITTTDNWRSGNMKGHCENSAYDSDAGQELLRRFNNPSLEYEFPHNSWINVYSTLNLSHDQYPNRIFYEVAPSEPCVEYNELQYYLTQGHYIIYNSSSQTPKGEKPAGLYFKLLILWTNDDFPSDHKYFHIYRIEYGTPVNIPPIE